MGEVKKEVVVGEKGMVMMVGEGEVMGATGTSSRAISNYQFDATFDRQFPTYGPGAYDIEHRFTLDLRYRKAFFGEYETRFNLFYERRSGVPFSWTMGSFRDGDLGDQRDLNSSSSYLPYIPTGPSDPNVIYRFTDYDEFSQHIALAGLSQYAGGYVPKNTGRTPYVTRIDLRIDQEIPLRRRTSSSSCCATCSR